jgi:deoxyadenosine/deoxycytidine kinase
MQEGNIFMVSFSGVPGVGKTSVMRKLQATKTLERAIIKRSGIASGDVIVRYVYEPSDVWESRGWLQQFYQDPVKNAFAFQLGVFDTHVDAVVNTTRKVDSTKTLVLIVERSMYDQLLFWEVNKKLANVDTMVDEVYQNMWKKWKVIPGYPKLSLIIFLNTPDIQDTLDRVNQRNRDGERNGITRHYQQALLDMHLEWFKDPVARPKHAPDGGITCMHVDAGKPYHVDDDHAQELIDEIASTIVVQLLMK